MYIGMDIHKRYAQVAVMDETGRIVEETRVENASLDEFAQRHAGATVALEATSNYYHIQTTLSEHLDVRVADPEELKLIGHSMQKSDQLDAKQLARLARLEAVPESYVPSQQLRECRELVRGRHSLIEQRKETANRVHALLNKQGITRNIKPLSQDGRESLRELSLEDPFSALLESYLRVIETVTDEIVELDEKIEEQAASIDAVQRLMTIPGVAAYSALTIYAELGEVERFDSEKEAVSYAGLDPVIRESGGSRKEGGISKEGSAHLRWVLVQCTMSAVHSAGDEYLSRFFNRLDQRKHSMVARVATARKLLVSIYHMLDREEVYDPPGVSS